MPLHVRSTHARDRSPREDGRGEDGEGGPAQGFGGETASRGRWWEEEGRTDKGRGRGRWLVVGGDYSSMVGVGRVLQQITPGCSWGSGKRKSWLSVDPRAQYTKSLFN